VFGSSQKEYVFKSHGFSSSSRSVTGVCSKRSSRFNSSNRFEDEELGASVIKQSQSAGFDQEGLVELDDHHWRLIPTVGRLL
jgi:hypothetical protein